MKTRSFRGRGAAREPGTHEHRTANILEMQVFLGSGLGPSDRPGMTLLGKINFFTSSFAGMARRANWSLAGGVCLDRHRGDVARARDCEPLRAASAASIVA